MPYSSPINFDHGTTGLTVTAAVYESDKATVVSGQSAVSLAEFPASSGQYSANLTLSSSGGYVVVNDGTTNRTLAYDRELSTQASVDVIDGVVDAILVDTAEIGAAGAGLTSVTLADGSITSATFANNAIDHTVLATNAIGNAQLATSAINAIQSGLGTLASQTTILTNLADVPTVAEFEARTLPSANYFDPVTDLVLANLTQISGDAVAADNLEALLDGTGGVTLSGTLSTVTNLTNLPAIPANWLTATGIATGAITSAKFASGAITSTVMAANSIGASQIANASITSAKFGSGAITSTVLATDSIGSAQLASSAVAEIQTGLSTLTGADVRTAVGLAAANLDTQLGDIPTVAEFNARTLLAGDYFDPATDPVATVTTLTNLPAIPANWLTASGLASDAVAEIQSGLATTANQTSILAGLTDIKGATFNGTTDSLEAIRDRGDASWTTATGFSTHTAADVWAVGTRTVTGGTINTNLDMRGTDNALLAADYTAPPTIAAINAEIVDALSVDTYAEPTTVPPATATIAQKIGWLFALARNKITQSATTQTLRNDADNATIGTSAVSDDGATTTRGEWQ